MAVNAASSSYVNSASSNKGFSGLASGVDTESMVEQLLSGTQTKIDKQEAMKQQLEWKQEIYRDIISQINDFQNKFFSYSSSSNLMSESFFNAMSAVTSSSVFKATATTSASTGASTMEVRRLATKASLSSGAAVSGKLTGKLDAEAMKKLVDARLGEEADYTVKFKVGEKNVSVNLRDLFVEGESFKSYPSSTQRDAAIQARLEEAFKDTGVTVSVKDGAMTLTSGGEKPQIITVASDSGKLGLQNLGLSASSRSATKSQAQVLSGKVDDTPKMSFTVTLDDLTKTVSIDMRKVMKSDGSVDTDKLKGELTTALNKAHGYGQVKVADTADGGFELVVSEGRKVAVGGSAETLEALGMKNGQSNRIGLGSTLADLNLATKLQGTSFRFTINGEEFHFDEDTAIIDVMDAINRSGAGVRMIYRAQDDRFVLEATESGAGKIIEMSQEEGNLINALFGSGVAGGKRMVSKKLSFEAPGTAGKITEDTKASATLKELGITGLTDKDGKEIDEDTKLSELASVSGGKYTISDQKIMQEADGDTTLDDLGIRLGGHDGTTKLSELSAKTGGKLVYEDGRIVMAKSYGYAGPVTTDNLEKLFGTRDFTLGGGAETDAKNSFVRVEGQNALVKIDGMLTERSSNSFSVNGINYDLTGVSGSYVAAAGKVLGSDGSEVTLTAGQYIENGTLFNADGTAVEGMGALVYQSEDGGATVSADGIRAVDDGKGGVQIQKFDGKADTVTVTQDTDRMMDGIKEFIDEYNKLVKTLNDYLDEDASYRDYQPLTDAQKKEMSEREIELWEEKAKEGLLRRDSTIDTFLQQMRTALYQKPSSGGYALYQLGIETGSWEMKGQLTFTTDGEAKLRQMLETDPSGVMKLFTDKEEGLGVKLNDILNKTAKISSGSPGTLVQIAGIKGASTDKDNRIYEQIKAIDDKIAALKRTYENEKTRYWNQFNAMEQAISNMNTQSAYLAQMMGMS